MFFGMSWRRFAALLSGLSPRSLLYVVAGDELKTIRDPKAAENAVAHALGPADYQL